MHAGAAECADERGGDGQVTVQRIQYGWPSRAATRFVERYVERKGRLGAVTVTIPVIARSCALLDFELGDRPHIRSCSNGLPQRIQPAALVGLETYVQNHLLVEGNFENFAIQFRPAAVKQLFGLQMPELTNRNNDAHAVLGGKASELRQRLGEARSFEERVEAANNFIVELGSDRAADDSIDSVAREILRSHGNCRMDVLAHKTAFSMRNFQRRFRECVGISPKLYARIVRFEWVLKAKAAAPQMSWMDVAHEAGYYDQMHMIHEFREFSNAPPTSMSGHGEDAFTRARESGEGAGAR